MSRLDTMYRAFAAHRKHTCEDRDCSKLRKLFARANAEEDKIEVVRTVCHIEEDWIEAIEQGLVHIGRALEEERQFIRSNGEVVPIEKVKSVSRESVEHLSRHSNLLTRKPKEGNIIPDQLFTVERLSDYSVYENRFLYMLLCFLRDFISFRYDRILALANTYHGTLRMHKAVEAEGRKTMYEVSLDEEAVNDAFLRENNPAKEKIDRIDLILKSVLLYLSTPLMEEVAKAPLLKPPVTETNVLKMNVNFNGALQLYYFVAAYDKDGFSIERTIKRLSPFQEAVADEFAESLSLIAFLTYEHGMSLESVFRERYAREEELRKQQEEERRLEQLKKLRKRIHESGGDPEAYMLLLEQRNRTLENDSMQYRAALAEIERLNEKNGRLMQEIRTLTDAVAEEKRVTAQQAEAHRAQIASLEEKHAGEIAALGEKHADEIAALRAQHEEYLSAAREETRRQREDYEARLSAAAEELRARGEENAALSGRLQEQEDAHMLLMAKYNAVRREHGLFTDADDFTSEDSFGEIERQYKLFRTFFKEEWKKTKKRIRKEVFAAAKAQPAAEVQPSEPTQPAAEAQQTEPTEPAGQDAGAANSPEKTDEND